MARNRVFSYCKNCYVTLNADAYDVRADTVEARRHAVWSYLAPRCAYCGFDKHASAMDLHHSEDGKEGSVSDLITRTTLAPTSHNVGRLLHEMGQCVPLCANCHRMLHAGALMLDPHIRNQPYTLVDLMNALESAG
jgi:hypothetical protein